MRPDLGFRHAQGYHQERTVQEFAEPDSAEVESGPEVTAMLQVSRCNIDALQTSRSAGWYRLRRS
jgi:hypothetical protein